jgi:hypothetical protein
VLSYKRDHGNWQEVQLDADRASYVLQSLHCGATYHAYLTAHNKVGNSRTSGIVTAVTKGGGKLQFFTNHTAVTALIPSQLCCLRNCFPVPLLPSSNELFSANATSITLQLSLWPDGGCAIVYFEVEYRLLAGNNRNWLLVDKNAPAEQLSVRDLMPATWYQFRLTARNDAGSTKAHFNFATTTITGGKTPLK